MNTKPSFGAKWSLVAFSVLLYGAVTAHAQGRLPSRTDKNSTASQGLLGQRKEELLTRYGKPTAVCFSPDSPPVKLFVPEGVPTFSPKTTPKWAQPVAFPLQGRQGEMVWFYKRNDKTVSYMIDWLGDVEAASAVGMAASANSKSGEFEVSHLPSAALGETASDVIKRYGYPDKINTVTKDVFELVYQSKDQEPMDFEAMATNFSIQGGKVARLTSYFYLSKPSSSKPTPDAWGGKFSLINP